MSLNQLEKTRGLRWGLVAFFLLGEFILIAMGIKGSVAPTEVRKISGYTPWSEEVIEVARDIPVQDGGRIKPFSTFARFQMLSFHGAVKMKIEAGGKERRITPTEWLLDCLFRPELANELPIFRIDDSEVLHRYGIVPKDRRARLSYNDLLKDYGKGPGGKDRLLKGGSELFEKDETAKRQREAMTPAQIKAMEAAATEEEKEEKRKEKLIKEFAQQVLNYEAMTKCLDFGRIELGEPAFPEELFKDGGKDPARFSTWISRWNQLRAVFIMSSQQGLEVPEAAQVLAGEIEKKLNSARYGVRWCPPHDPEEKEWISIGERIIRILEIQDFQWDTIDEEVKELESLEGGEVPERLEMAAFWKELMDDMMTLEDLVAASGNPDSKEFLSALESWRDEVTARAKVRGEGETIAGEVTYYERNYFMRALVFFLIAFIFSAFGWFGTKGKFGKVVRGGTIAFFVLALLYLSWGILHRSILMGRPPVGNLYDTIPFITLGATLVLGISEWLTKRNLLISMGSALGVAGMFMAFRFEYGDATDHMDPLVAVLKSNYWLATHVVTVTLGYSGGLMACFLSMVYVHLRLAGVIEDDKKFRRFMTRAVYGIVCFTLLFSLVGTVLGGIWANDSWGRFWGWDPKENGALLIVLWSLIILHARLAGWMSDWGIHLCCIFFGAVVAFSWWHVNMLEVGLHSYGFIKGGSVIWLFYGACATAFVVGVIGLIIDRVYHQKPKGS
ncbi:cytochrome c biogenesis protein CcsA [Akkermansiaceae bacterium]|nr:cytochrome c biogenesis protein CcsA [Akkermansiaceae bacterium]MDB4537912.1 cytochrome c biogenesis protein CcsA [Akkermansiaceae bacterium]